MEGLPVELIEHISKELNIFNVGMFYFVLAGSNAFDRERYRSKIPKISKGANDEPLFVELGVEKPKFVEIWMASTRHPTGKKSNTGWIHVAAVAHCNLELLEWLHLHHQSVRDVRLCLSCLTIQAMYDTDRKLVILQWLHRNMYLLDTCCHAAACKLGLLDIVLWLESKYCYRNIFDSICAAAGEGHLHVYQHLHPVTLRRHTCTLPLNVSFEAAKTGHLHILKHMYTTGCTFFEGVQSIAIEHGHVHILQWLYDEYKSDTIQWDLSHCVDAIDCEQLEVIKWFKSIGIWDKELFLRYVTQSRQTPIRQDIVEWIQNA